MAISEEIKKRIYSLLIKVFGIIKLFEGCKEGRGHESE